MEDYIPIERTQECKKCNKILPVSYFQKIYSSINSVCSECLKQRSNENNKIAREKIEKASGGCWWVKSYCSTVLKLKK